MNKLKSSSSKDTTSSQLSKNQLKVSFSKIFTRPKKKKRNSGFWRNTDNSTVAFRRIEPAHGPQHGYDNSSNSQEGDGTGIRSSNSNAGASPNASTRVMAHNGTEESVDEANWSFQVLHVKPQTGEESTSHSKSSPAVGTVETESKSGEHFRADSVDHATALAPKRPLAGPSRELGEVEDEECSTGTHDNFATPWPSRTPTPPRSIVGLPKLRPYEIDIAQSAHQFGLGLIIISVFAVLYLLISAVE